MPKQIIQNPTPPPPPKDVSIESEEALAEEIPSAEMSEVIE